MSDTDQKREDDVLRRMLATEPTPHKEKTAAALKLRRQISVTKD